MVEAAVVVARQPALVVLGEALRASRTRPAVTASHEDVPAALVGVETKATRPPSGDQRGSRFTAPFAVSGRDGPAGEIEQPSSIASSR